jgi:23S rRNA (uridine2552-2'-O)-methyltransferase
MPNYTKPDSWSLKAQKEGYPARSIYKLREIDERFGLLAAFSGKALDLGASPGSWSLYTLRQFAKSKGEKKLAAADLTPLSRQYDKGLFNNENFFFIQGDITTPETRDALLARGPFSLIMSDMAPATTGNNLIDTLRSLALAETAFEYAQSALVRGGALVVKVFQGAESVNLLRKIKTLFNQGQSFKPAACRRESFETYYIGLGKK